MSYMMAQKIGKQGEKTLLCLTIFLLNAEPFFPLVAPTCQKAGKANNGEFFKGKANVTCEYHVKNFRIVLFSLVSLRPVLQPFVVSTNYQTFIGMSGLVACGVKSSKCWKIAKLQLLCVCGAEGRYFSLTHENVGQGETSLTCSCEKQEPQTYGVMLCLYVFYAWSPGRLLIT